LVSACAGAEETAEQSAPPPAPVAAVAVDLDGFLTAAAKPYEGTTLQVQIFNSPQADTIELLAPRFTELTGIEVVFTKLAENDAVTKTQVTLAAESDIVDVFQTQSFFVGGYGSQDSLVSLGDLQANDAITYSGFSFDNYSPSSVTALSYGGESLGVPMFHAQQVMYYRLDIFEELGIEVPETLDELELVLEAIHNKPLPAIALRSAVGPTQNLWPFTTWLYNDGGGYWGSFDASTNVYSDPIWSSDASVAAADRYGRILREYGPTGALNWTVADVVASFLSGQVAIIQEGTPFGATIQDPEKSTVVGKVGAFPIPAGSAGAYAPSGAHGWSISAYSKNQEASWLFAQWAGDPATIKQATIDYSFSSPPIPALFQDPDFVEKYDFPGFLDAVGTTSERPGSPVGGNYLPGILNWSEVAQTLSEKFSEIITGRQDAKSAMTEAEEALEKAKF
jgi:ABC-type glycerol-3-phosphate transport system substrate-binding protein